MLKDKTALINELEILYTLSEEELQGVVGSEGSFANADAESDAVRPFATAQAVPYYDDGDCTACNDIATVGPG